MARWLGDADAVPAGSVAEDNGALKPATITRLSDLAGESFKRQSELDGSAWRSLPFFAVTRGLAATILGAVAQSVPRFGSSVLAMVLNGLLVLATISFGWAVRWFCTVVRPRDHEYPSPDADERAYAEAMTQYHAASGLAGDQLDQRVVTELQPFLTEQYGTAARTNFAHNAARM